MAVDIQKLAKEEQSRRARLSALNQLAQFNASVVDNTLGLLDLGAQGVAGISNMITGRNDRPVMLSPKVKSALNVKSNPTSAGYVAGAIAPAMATGIGSMIKQGVLSAKNLLGGSAAEIAGYFGGEAGAQIGREYGGAAGEITGGLLGGVMSPRVDMSTGSVTALPQRDINAEVERAKAAYELAPNNEDLRKSYMALRRERDAMPSSPSPARDSESVISESQANDYRGAHEPPDREYGAPLNDLTSMIPSDVYGPAGPRLYGLGDSEVDSEAFSALRSAKGNPDAEVVVYRAVPKGVSDINAGDWVTTSRKYAEMHGENALGGQYEILEQKAKAGDLYSEGYPYEFGWNPLSMTPEARMQRAQEGGFDTSRVAYRGLSGEYDPSKAGNYQMFTSSPEDAGEYGSSVVSAYLNKGNNLVVDGGRNNFNSIPVRNLPDDVRANLHSSVGDVARTDDIAYAAQLAGYDSVSINNVFDKASNEIPIKPLPASNEPMSQEMIDILDEVNASGMLDSTPDVALPPEIPRNYEPATIDIIFDPKNIRSTNAEFDPAKADSADLLSSVGTTSALRGIA